MWVKDHVQWRVSHKFCSREAAGLCIHHVSNLLTPFNRSPAIIRRPPLTCLSFQHALDDGSNYGSSLCCSLLHFYPFFWINVIELLVIVWSSEELRGAERVPMFPVSPVNKAESVPCSFIGTVCCEHVPSLCSLHLKAFQALHVVCCHNNGLVVYPRGRSDAQTCKAAPPPFLSVTAISLVLVFAAENGQLWENHQNHAWKKKVKTH